MMHYVELTYGQVATAALLILINGVISVVLRLRMERSLAVASVRTVVQLLLVGLVLEWVFRIDRWYIVIGLATLMTLIAGVTAAGRNERRYAGMWFNTIVSLWASAWLVMAFALMTVLQGIDKWYQPQYAIPLLGMVLGNTLNGVSVGLSALTESLVTRRAEVDGLLALGATRWEAASAPVRHAVRTGLTPITNAMMVVGIVSLPGMMTGQLVSGMAPIQAVKYQIVIMFLIASATALATVSVVLLSFLRLFSRDHQFLSRRISTPRPRQSCQHYFTRRTRWFSARTGDWLHRRIWFVLVNRLNDGACPPLSRHHSTHTMVQRVADVDGAVAADADAVRSGQFGGGRGTSVAGAAAMRRTLTGDGRNLSGSDVNAADGLVFRIDDIDMAGRSDRDSLGTVEPGLARVPAVAAVTFLPRACHVV